MLISIQARIIAALGAVAILFVLALGIAHHFEDRGRALAAGEWAPKLAAEHAAWLKKEADERTADLALQRKHDADIAALAEHHQQIERETSEKHESEMAQLRRERDADRRRADAAGGLRIPAPAGAAACAAGGAVAGTETPGAGGRDDAGAGTIRLPQQIENDLWAIVNDADEVSARLRSCQGWIRANGFYGPAQPLLDRMIAAPNEKPEETE